MKSGNRYIIGMDHGNNLIKTANHIMQNGMKRLATKPILTANTLNYGRAYYKVGEERISVKDSKTADDDYYILTFTMLAKEAKTRDIPQGSHIMLAVGMPLKQFSSERDAFIRYLKRDSQPVSFKYEDTAYKLYIDKDVARKLALTPEALKVLKIIWDMQSDHEADSLIVRTRTGKGNTATNLEHRMATIFRNAGLSDLSGGLHIFRRTYSRWAAETLRKTIPESGIRRVLQVT